MSEKIQKSLSSFMKKQIDEKSSKKISEQKPAESEERNSPQEEMTEDEKQKLAKEQSLIDVADQDEEAIRKLILKNIIYYTAIITILVIFAIGVIKIAPALLSFLNGLIYKLFIGSLKQ
jgi:hypothetical protein